LCMGASDSSKSCLAKAIGVKACMNDREVYNHYERLLEKLFMQEAMDYQNIKGE